MGYLRKAKVKQYNANKHLSVIEFTLNENEVSKTKIIFEIPKDGKYKGQITNAWIKQINSLNRPDDLILLHKNEIYQLRDVFTRVDFEKGLYSK